MEDNFSIDSSVIRDCETDSILKYANKHKESFGIEFLDDALLGILPNDLVLVGARSGVGKTQLCSEIAKNNAMMRKNVVFIALEAEPNEIEMRLKFSIVANLFFRDPHRPISVDMNYRSWRFGVHRDQLSIYEREATRIFTERYATMRTVYRGKHFGYDDLAKVFLAVHKDTDLIILDHVQFMDLQTGSNNVEETSRLIKGIRTLNLHYNIPVILVSHVRKGHERLIPSLDDYHGSSDIAKIATVAVMLAKNNNDYDAKNGVYGTYLGVAKSRTGNPGLVGMMKYSIKHNTYMIGYELGKENYSGDKIEKVAKENWPSWAVNRCVTESI